MTTTATTAAARYKRFMPKREFRSELDVVDFEPGTKLARMVAGPFIVVVVEDFVAFAKVTEELVDDHELKTKPGLEEAEIGIVELAFSHKLPVGLVVPSLAELDAKDTSYCFTKFKVTVKLELTASIPEEGNTA